MAQLSDVDYRRHGGPMLPMVTITMTAMLVTDA